MAGTATGCRSIAGSAARPASRTPARTCTAPPPCTTSRRRRTPPTRFGSSIVRGRGEGRASTTTRSTTGHHALGARLCSRNRRPPCTSTPRSRRPRTRRRSCRVGSRFAADAMYRRPRSRPGVGSSRLRAEVRRGHVLAADRDAVRVGATRDRQEEAVAVLERRDGRARRPCPAGRPHRERDPDRVPAARRADGDASLRHRARKSTEDRLGDGDGNRDGLRRDRGDRPGGDQREDGDARDDQQPTIASPPRCADLVAVLRARRLLPTTDPLPQAHGAIMQLSNADSGLIVVPPSGVFMLSGPTSDAGASAV